MDITYSKSMDQPGRVVNPARGQPNPFAPENLVSRDGFGRPVPRQPDHSPTQAEFIIVLTHGVGFLPFSAAASIYLFIPPTAIGSVPSSSGHAIAYRWHSLPRVHRHRGSNLQGSSSNACCLFRYHHGPTSLRLFFSHTHYWYSADILMLVCNTERYRGLHWLYGR